MKTLLYFGLIIIVASCGNGTSEKIDDVSQSASSKADSLFDVVMHEHNVAMAKQRQLEGYQLRIDSLSKGKSATQQENYKSLNAELKSAYDGMEKWMHEFVFDSLQDQPEQRIQYLSSEETKVVKVKNDILSAIDKADSVLKK